MFFYFAMVPMPAKFFTPAIPWHQTFQYDLTFFRSYDIHLDSWQFIAVHHLIFDFDCLQIDEWQKFQALNQHLSISYDTTVFVFLVLLCFVFSFGLS